MSTNTRRSATVVRVAAVITILFAPIVAAKWQTGGAAGDDAVHPVEPGSDGSRAVAQYLASRNAVIDKLLPEGAGGTRFSQSLDGDAGRAIAGTATILVAAAHLEGGEATELHERAHLLHAFLAGEVSRLVAKLPHPARGLYAAKNSREHFAEMAAEAWRLVSPPGDFCFVDTPAERMRTAEEDVPGTSGFVIWYLRAVAAPDSEQLVGVASQLASPVGAEWDAIWAAIEERRLADGTFESWQVPDVPGHLKLWRAEEWHSGGWWGKIAATILAPSALLAHAF